MMQAMFFLVLEQFLVIAIVITMLKLKKPMIQNK